MKQKPVIIIFFFCLFPAVPFASIVVHTVALSDIIINNCLESVLQKHCRCHKFLQHTSCVFIPSENSLQQMHYLLLFDYNDIFIGFLDNNNNNNNK